jgi:hypothetical protein
MNFLNMNSWTLFRYVKETYNIAVLNIIFFVSKIKIYATEWYANRSKFPVEFVGDNWKHKKELPIAVLFGFNPWKRQVTSTYLSEYRTAFALGNSSFRRVKNNFLNLLPPDEKITFVAWGRKLPIGAQVHIFIRNIFKKKIDVKTVEDGFLRSMGNGLLHSRPASLCIDGSGIYFDANKGSDLEKLLETKDFNNDEKLIQRAQNAINLMKDARLTKYYDIRPYSSTGGITRSKRYSILVVGQVEDDASVISGKSKIVSNEGLILQAKNDFPDADIYFRPHPDYWYGNRKNKKLNSRISKISAVIPPTSSLYEVFTVVDHVYTITSLAGFEALIYGLKVTTFGAPFYSNWGLTDDRVIIKRRTKTLSIQEIFSVVYFDYPKYLHPESDEFTSYEDIASQFIVEAIKHEDIFTINKNDLFKKCLQHEKILSLPFKLISYLNNTGNYAAADTNHILRLVEHDFKLSDYPQTSHLLGQTSNFDALVKYSNYCINYLSKNINELIGNTTLIESFFYNLARSQANSNGRVIDLIPNLNSSVVQISSRDENFSRIVTNYIKCLSNNLQYDIIDEFIKMAKSKSEENKNNSSKIIFKNINDLISDALSFQLTTQAYRSICLTLSQKPTRSERNYNKRHQLTLTTANIFIGLLDSKYNHPIDNIINRIDYSILLDNSNQAKEKCDTLLDLINFKGLSQNEPVKYLKTIIERKNDLIRIGLQFTKNLNLKHAGNIIELIPPPSRDFQFSLLYLNYQKSIRNRTTFFEYYENLEYETKKQEKILGLYASMMRELGYFDAAILAHQELANKAKTLAKRVSIEREIAKIEFCKQSSAILNSVAQPALPRGVIFLASQTCFNTLAMMIPSLVELKKKGYSVINLMEGMTEHQPTGIEYIDKFSGAIPTNFIFPKLQNEWVIDWDKKIVSSNGINFYQGFYERLSTFTRRYHIDLNIKSTSKAFFNTLNRADACLSICKKIFSDIVSNGIPASFISGNSHVTPFSVFRDFARHKNHPLLSFVNCNVAYESYYTNLGSKFANTMCVTDMTLYPNIRAPFMARKDQFDNWYMKNESDPTFIEKSNSLINVNRVGSSTDLKELELINFIKSKKAEGKKILCAFGKIPVDLNVPYDGGPAHIDMADWINHTVSICSKSDDIVLLVKPHPHELRPEIALDLVDSFHDLIKENTSNNIILLGHKDINGHALAPYLDLAILYNGSTGLELTAQNTPVIMTSHFGKHDYPINLNYPQSREQYEYFLLSLNYPLPSSETRKKAAFLMCYLGTDEISILNQYSIRQLTNDTIGVPKWRMDNINNFLEYGDPKMRLIANRIVEKFEVNH